MLIQTILLMFALLGIVAAVVDLGYARIAQVQMQTGVDSAALEGLRGRDAVIGDAAASDLARRQDARLFATKSYEDPAGERLVGAGPAFTLSGGRTAANAAQLLVVSADPVYRPTLALNSANVIHGDIVSGAPVGSQAGVENDSYGRDDFVPADTNSAPAGEAVLVRMRRTDGRNTLDTPDGSTVSAGPALPLLFGLGSTVTRADPSSYSVRHHGFTVRATAIASSRPARRISSSLAASFALTKEFWINMPNAAAYSLTSNSGGSLTLPASGTVAGYSTTAALTVIGQNFTTAGLVPVVSSLRLYVPIYDTISGVNCVIGFGYVLVNSDGSGGLSLTPTRNRVADRGATAQVAEGVSGTAADIAAITSANASLPYALAAPALIR